MNDDAADQLLHAIFEVCDTTEEIEPTNDFERGRVFEAKHIQKTIGDWFQHTFCGAVFMGEPVLKNPAELLLSDIRLILSTLTDKNAHTPGRADKARNLLPKLDAYIEHVSTRHQPGLNREADHE